MALAALHLEQVRKMQSQFKQQQVVMGSMVKTA